MGQELYMIALIIHKFRWRRVEDLDCLVQMNFRIVQLCHVNQERAADALSEKVFF